MPTTYSESTSTSRVEKTLWQKSKDILRVIVAFLLGQVGICILVVGYMILGAFTFIAIEGEADKARAMDMLNLRKNTVARLWEITESLNILHESNWTEAVSNEVLEFQRQIVHAVLKEGYDGKSIETGGQWSFSAGFLYSLTVITTIGYGNITPHSHLGKAATLIYAILGIPLFLLYLTNIGGLFARSFKWIYAKVCKCYCLKDVFGRPPGPGPGGGGGGMDGESMVSAGERSFDGYYSEDDVQSITVPIPVCLAVMVAYILGGGILFVQWEDWSVFEGSYFCFISLSTIGLGDLVPGDSIHKTGSGTGGLSDVVQVSFILCSMYLMLGMALIGMCFNLMQEEVLAKVRAMTRRCGFGSQEDLGDEDYELAELDRIQDVVDRIQPVPGEELCRQTDS